jgi:phage gpG-like protein
MKLSAEITGSSQVVERIKQITPNVRTALQERVQRLIIALQIHVVSDKLQGQVLNVRTGKLQRSVSQAMVSGSPDEIKGIVSASANYAAAHEYGFHGTVTVKEHLRTIKEAFGKELKDPVTFTVHTHTANMNIPEASFLRSALDDQRDSIKQGIQEAVNEGARK